MLPRQRLAIVMRREEHFLTIQICQWHIRSKALLRVHQNLCSIESGPSAPQ